MTQTFNNEQLDLICRSLAITSTGISEHFTADECKELEDLLKEIEIKYMQPYVNLEYPRYEYNVKILDALKENREFHDIVVRHQPLDFDTFMEEMGNLIDIHHQQRFGQIWCNYVVPQYRKEGRTKFLELAENLLFGDTKTNIFCIESKTTFNKLIKV